MWWNSDCIIWCGETRTALYDVVKLRLQYLMRWNSDCIIWCGETQTALFNVVKLKLQSMTTVCHHVVDLQATSVHVTSDGCVTKWTELSSWLPAWPVRARMTERWVPWGVGQSTLFASSLHLMLYAARHALCCTHWPFFSSRPACGGEKLHFFLAFGA